VHHAVCLFTSKLSLVLIAPTHGEMARLSDLDGWLQVTYQNGHPSKYQPEPASINFVDATEDVTEYRLR